jgi:hypothetical protein
VTVLDSRASRVVWAWCLVYTALAAAEPRRRRRGEMLSHLWESERAGMPPSLVLRAAVTGAAADLAWAAASTLRAVGHGAREPGVHLAAAAVLSVQAAFLWNWTSPRTTHLVEAASTAIAGLLLAAAGAACVARRRSG